MWRREISFSLLLRVPGPTSKSVIKQGRHFVSGSLLKITKSTSHSFTNYNRLKVHPIFYRFATQKNHVNCVHCLSENATYSFN